MTVFLNGEFVPPERATVSVLDRGFIYGDGLFETMAVFGGRPFRWAQHLLRIRCGAQFLQIPVPYSDDFLTQSARDLIRGNDLSEGVIRLILSRGVGPRGYSIRGCGPPTLVMTTNSSLQLDRARLPRWRLATASLRGPAHDPLATHKTCNKLLQILARTEAEAAGADEALILNTDDEIAEGASSNVFWIQDDIVHTTPLASGILAGVTREVALGLARDLSWEIRETRAKSDDLTGADGVFVSLSTLGIVEITALDQVSLRQSPRVAELQEAYWTLVERECGAGPGRS